ncbi:MAG: hypothetical protein E7072_10545 [Bacteroidales bacterium]|nr:hypothetical protein [Bacteroidales bacterium]
MQKKRDFSLSLDELIVRKKKIKIIEIIGFIFLFIALFFTIKVIFLFILNVILFIGVIRDVYLRCKDRSSFIKIAFDGVICVDTFTSTSFSYKWIDVKKIEIKKVINCSMSNVDFVIETDSNFSSICIDSFDISPTELLDSLKRIAPINLKDKIYYVKSY